MEVLFLSTLSLRRATNSFSLNINGHLFLSTLSLRRATLLLCLIFLLCRLFLSTLSLRRATCFGKIMSASSGLFLSTLSLRRATALGLLGWLRVLISIHALLAESDWWVEGDNFFYYAFLSTLSLRRATYCMWLLFQVIMHFYPRSPCGERRITDGSICLDSKISIHALLAESDLRVLDGSKSSIISIHALLAESDKPSVLAVTETIISIHALLAESD